MVRKRKASDLKIYNESLSRGKNIHGKKYILDKKEKANLVIPIEKKQKTCIWLVKRKETLLGLPIYNAKSAQY